MKLFLKISYLLTVVFFLQAGNGYSDTIILLNGDRLSGEIKNEYFILHGTYSQMTVQKAFCKNLNMEAGRSLSGSLKTVNNDLFSGILLNREIRILRADDVLETVPINDLNSLFIDFSGPSSEVLTTIFKMQNGDRFSGKVANPTLTIRNENLTATYEPSDINRIEFTSDVTGTAKMLLTNGDIVQGSLQIDELMIQPDSMARISVHWSKFETIQFNSSKMMLKAFDHSAPSGADLDQDGVPDNADSCPDTPRGVRVDKRGCRAEELAAVVESGSDKEGGQPGDEDGDGVSDNIDKCPLTPGQVAVDKDGCWKTGAVLFDFDSHLIMSSDYPVLDDVLAVLMQNPALKIEIQGRTDNIGTSAYNRTLSENRARAAKKYLVDKGVDPARLNAVGYGASRRMASNETAAGRAMNRRVDFVVIP